MEFKYGVCTIIFIHYYDSVSFCMFASPRSGAIFPLNSKAALDYFPSSPILTWTSTSLNMRVQARSCTNQPTHKMISRSKPSLDMPTAMHLLYRHALHVPRRLDITSQLPSPRHLYFSVFCKLRRKKPWQTSKNVYVWASFYTIAGNLRKMHVTVAVAIMNYENKHNAHSAGPVSQVDINEVKKLVTLVLYAPVTSQVTVSRLVTV